MLTLRGNDLRMLVNKNLYKSNFVLLSCNLKRPKQGLLLSYTETMQT